MQNLTVVLFSGCVLRELAANHSSSAMAYLMLSQGSMRQLVIQSSFFYLQRFSSLWIQQMVGIGCLSSIPAAVHRTWAARWRASRPACRQGPMLPALTLTPPCRPACLRCCLRCAARTDRAAPSPARLSQPGRKCLPAAPLAQSPLPALGSGRAHDPMAARARPAGCPGCWARTLTLRLWTAAWALLQTLLPRRPPAMQPLALASA